MSRIRVIVPDSHGCMIDKGAEAAFLKDLKTLHPFEIIMLGDHVDVGGMFNAHPNNYVDEMEYSYESDCAAANSFLDQIQKLAPRADIHYLEGNHEAHVSRWIARTYRNLADAKVALDEMDPWRKLKLRDRGIHYYRSNQCHHGITVPGVIQRGPCYFMHGMSACKHAAAAHVDAIGANIVFGHTHRAQSHIRRNLKRGEIGGWCPGCLSGLQPMYMHTRVTDWSHGYAIQAVDRDLSFMHIQIPIIGGHSKLATLLNV